MNYNTDQTLWENYKKDFPNSQLAVCNGLLFDITNIKRKIRGDDAIGCFASQEDAIATLQLAGWKQSTIKFFGCPVFVTI